MVRRIYTEKRLGAGHNPDVSSLLAEFRDFLKIRNADRVRELIRYDIEGFSGSEYEACKTTVFSEPAADIVYENDFPRDAGDFLLAVKYLPGQYDQRADSAVFCSALLRDRENPVVIETARVYAVSGDLTDADKEKIKRHLINPVDETEASFEIPEKLGINLTEPPPVKVLDGFVSLDEKGLDKLCADMRLAMNIDDLKVLRDYFRDEERRDPSVSEIRVVDTYWSDHCRHTTFLTEITDVKFCEGSNKNAMEQAYSLYLEERKRIYGDKADSKPISLMDLALMGMKSMKSRGLLDDLEESEEINAAGFTVKAVENGIETEWLVMFKNETHNHPTEIEPFGGAATCLGGAIRDPLSGRSFVYQAMRVTGSADPRAGVDETISGKLPQRRITQTAADGYSSYGNQIGLATGLVSEVYHPGYAAKRMEIGAVIGAARRSHVVRKSPEPGDIIILAGGRTGRDGIGGATGSSKEHTGESNTVCGAEVQKGNAPTERKLQRLFRDPAISRLIKKCNDFGAGGVAVAVGELADGLEIDLDKVLKKYEGLDGTELAISESQERMAVVVSPEDVPAFIKGAETENLEAVPIARVNGGGRLVMLWRGQPVVNISRDFLNKNGAKRCTEVIVSEPKFIKNNNKNENICERWLSNLSALNVCCQKGLSEMFDSVVGAGTILMPYGGKRQLTPIQAMAAKLPVIGGDVNLCTLMSYGYNPGLSEKSPFEGAAAAVVESAAKIVAAGGKLDRIKLSFQEYFGKPGDDPARFGIPFQALLGAFKAQMELKIAAIGGKDSMSGTYQTPDGDVLDVPPTLVSFAVAAEEHKTVISPEFKGSGHLIGLLPCGRGTDGLPDFNAFKDNARIIGEGMASGCVLSAYAIGSGGAAAAISKMAFGNWIGADINTDKDLFNEDIGGFVLEITKPVKGVVIIGSTTDEASIKVNGEVITLDKAVSSWMEPLETVFPTFVPLADKDVPSALSEIRPAVKKASVPISQKPRVLIPVFPGTNSEYDTMASFDKAGAETDVFVIRNNTIKDLRESVKALAERINKAQIIALPGGFSAGDEPDGSGKYIASMFRSPAIKEAVSKLLKERDGLMLGICNGFQALIKLGLLPCGEIRDMDENSPTLTYNIIGRHASFLARTMVTSNLSPWFAMTKPGEIYNMPISHGEGRFIAGEDEAMRLLKNGQIAAQYVDLEGRPTMDTRYNPNGSLFALEALTSPDGRILGKMGHSERISDGVYKNVPGPYDQKIFESAVKYFKHN